MGRVSAHPGRSAGRCGASPPKPNAQHQRGPLLDVVPAAFARAIEHHEIAAYGTMRTLARSSGMGAVADLLEQTLREEKAADGKLTALADGEINPAAPQQAA